MTLPTNEHQVQLIELVKSWGGKLHVCTFKTFNNLYRFNNQFSMAPFQYDYLGIIWSTKTIACVKGHFIAGNVIHEIAHVFASAQPPKTAVEFDFFGWEYCLARLIKLPFKIWAEHNKEYIIENDDDSFGSCSKKEQKEIIFNTVQNGRDNGIIDKWKPLAIR